MSFQAYLDNVKAKTGKSPAEFAKLATQKGLTKHGEIVAWLKSAFELGHGHATAVAGVILKGGNPPRSDAKKLEDLFSGTKASESCSRHRLPDWILESNSKIRPPPGASNLRVTGTPWSPIACVLMMRKKSMPKCCLG